MPCLPFWGLCQGGVKSLGVSDWEVQWFWQPGKVERGWITVLWYSLSLLGTYCPFFVSKRAILPSWGCQALTVDIKAGNGIRCKHLLKAHTRALYFKNEIHLKRLQTHPEISFQMSKAWQSCPPQPEHNVTLLSSRSLQGRCRYRTAT